MRPAPVAGNARRGCGPTNPSEPDVTGRVFVGGDLTFDAYTSGDTKDIVDEMMDTGDMGYLDRAGRLFIVGREDDMIVSWGENVYPRAVENALAEYPDVADNAVIGVEDEAYGQRLVAFVVPHPDANIHEASVREFLKDRVSRFEELWDIKIVEKMLIVASSAVQQGCELIADAARRRR